MANIDLALARIARIQLLLEGWQHNGSISSIERKVMLDQLSALYDELVFAATTPAPATTEAKVKKVKPAVEEEKNQAAKEEVVEQPVVPKKHVQPEKTMATEEPAAPQVIEEPRVASKTVVETVAEVVAGKPKEEKKPIVKKDVAKPEKPSGVSNGKTDVRLGEQLNSGRKSLFESFGERDTNKATQLSAIENLSRAIGINDRFLFTKELFGGNQELFERTVSTLNSCENIEEAFMHIHQNFQWSDDNPVVKQLVLLLRRRFMS